MVNRVICSEDVFSLNCTCLFAYIEKIRALYNRGFFGCRCET